MRFELEGKSAPGNICRDLYHVTTARIKIGDKETFSLPTTSYTGFNDSEIQRFTVLEYSRASVEKVLTDLSQGLQLKLEKIGNHYKLALVTSSGKPYYYYLDKEPRNRGDDISYNVATIDRIPRNKTNGQYVYIYDHERCNVRPELLENSKVLIDPKDIMSSRDINLILRGLESSPALLHSYCGSE